MAIGSNLSNPVRAGIEFNDPEEIPADTVGDLTNEADFQPPEDVGAPDDTVAGGTRSDIEIELLENGTPDERSFGGVLGNNEDGSVRDLAAPDTTQIFDEIEFSLPDSLAPENRFVESTDERNISPENANEENASEQNAEESMD